MPGTIKIFLSSRSRDQLDLNDDHSPPLSEVKQRIQTELQDEEILGKPDFYEVWINETAPPAGGEHNATEECRAQVRRADLVIVLYNGDSGWAAPGNVGICEIEYLEALNHAPKTLRVVALPKSPKATGPQHERFQGQVEGDAHFHASAGTADEVVDIVRSAVREATIELTKAGAVGARGASYYQGAPLVWARLDYDRRSEEMLKAVEGFFIDQKAKADPAEPHRVDLDLAGESVRFALHAIPAALSIGAARERTGQPFLRDHDDQRVVNGKSAGPVHLIACHQGVTEAQALRQLGFPDAMILSTPFGVYVADDVQRVQMIFLKDCRDEASTHQRCDQLISWLRDQREDELLVERAVRRAEIVRTIAK
jgi:hypothetical protein